MRGSNFSLKGPRRKPARLRTQYETALAPRMYFRAPRNQKNAALWTRSGQVATTCPKELDGLQVSNSGCLGEAVAHGLL